MNFFGSWTYLCLNRDNMKNESNDQNVCRNSRKRINDQFSEKYAFFLKEISTNQVIIPKLLSNRLRLKFIYQNDSIEEENGKKIPFAKIIDSKIFQLLLNPLTHCHLSMNIVLHVIEILLHLCQVGNNCICLPCSASNQSFNF